MSAAAQGRNQNRRRGWGWRQSGPIETDVRVWGSNPQPVRAGGGVRQSGMEVRLQLQTRSRCHCAAHPLLAGLGRLVAQT